MPEFYPALTLLIDHGGKAVVDVYDEYTLPGRYPNKGKRHSGTSLSTPKLNTPRRITVDEFYKTGDTVPSRVHTPGALHRECIHQLHSEPIPPRELADTQFVLSEMSAMEPTGSELEGSTEGCPLPLSPLPLLFAMTELRDERAANHRSKKRKLDSDRDFIKTFYHP
jgi:hypothetical protein